MKCNFNARISFLEELFTSANVNANIESNVKPSKTQVYRSYSSKRRRPVTDQMSIDFIKLQTVGDWLPTGGRSFIDSSKLVVNWSAIIMLSHQCA